MSIKNTTKLGNFPLSDDFLEFFLSLRRARHCIFVNPDFFVDNLDFIFENLDFIFVNFNFFLKILIFLFENLKIKKIY